MATYQTDLRSALAHVTVAEAMIEVGDGERLAAAS